MPKSGALLPGGRVPYGPLLCPDPARRLAADTDTRAGESLAGARAGAKIGPAGRRAHFAPVCHCHAAPARAPAGRAARPTCGQAANLQTNARLGPIIAPSGRH